MKQIEKKDTEQVSGGVYSPDGCTQPPVRFPDSECYPNDPGTCTQPEPDFNNFEQN